jgi:hypothetical protein
MSKLRFQSFLFFIIVSGFIYLSAVPGFSQDDEVCLIQISKITPPPGEVFEFIQNLNGVESSFFIQSFGDQADIPIKNGDVITITEVVPEGWRFEDILVFGLSGVLIERVENGIKFKCIGPGFSNGAVAFINRRVAPIPTLSEWGMIAAAAGLGLVGVFYAVRRRKAIVN